MDMNKAAHDFFMELGEAMFGDDFRKQYEEYIDRKKELCLDEVSNAVARALSDHGVPLGTGSRIHRQVLTELFPPEEKEEKMVGHDVEKTLANTVDDMLSRDYKERFVAEYNQLSIRIRKLEKILDGDMTFRLSCPPDILREQLDAMKAYKSALEKRFQFEGIKEEK